MVSASRFPGAPRPLPEPWHWRRAKSGETHVLLSFALAAAFHAAVLALAFVAPKNALSSGFWVPVQATIDVEIETTPAAAAPTPSGAESRALETSPGTLPDAPFVRASDIPARTAAAGGRSPDGARPASDRPSVDGPLSATPRSSRPETTDAPGAPLSDARITASNKPEYTGPPPAAPLSSGALSLLVLSPGSDGFSSAPASPGGTDSASPAPGGKGIVQGQGASGASTTSPKPAVDKTIATRLLHESLGERDKSLGLTLPAAGNVASALQSAVRQALGPSVGSATFLAILTPSGQILTITPTAMNGGSAEAWANAARSAAASLSGRSFAMGAPFQNGAVVWIDVTSTFVLPSGAAAPIGSEPGGIRFDVSDIGRGKQQIIRTKIRVAAVK